MRKNYEMSKEDLETLLNAMKPTPMVMLQCGQPSSPQENANKAWVELGRKMHFDGMTVRPTGQGDRFFSAESEKPHVVKDGDSWCAHWSDFVDLQSSESAFGDTAEQAVKNLIEQVK
jgi:hypothetical protein